MRDETYARRICGLCNKIKNQFIILLIAIIYEKIGPFQWMKISSSISKLVNQI